VQLSENTFVGDLVSLKNVETVDTVFESNPLPTEVASPITGLVALSEIENCRFDRTKVGRAVRLRSVEATATVIPAGMSISNTALGIPTSSDLGLPLFPLEEDSASIREVSNLLNQLALPGYKPGVFRFGEMRDQPDWENLRQHVQCHSEHQLIARATNNPTLRKITVDAVKDLLDMRKSDGTHVTDDLTAEEIWGSTFEIVTLCTGNPDPYRRDKLKARRTAMDLLDEFSECEWPEQLRLVISANVIDYTSARVVAKLDEQPDYFTHALREAIHAPLTIDCSEQFRMMALEGRAKRIIWLMDNDGEAVFDLWLIQLLLEQGHEVTVVGKDVPASNDATLADVQEIVAHRQFQALQDAITAGKLSLISSGSRTIGTNLHQATPEFASALLDTEFVISKGQGNFYTTPGLKCDTFYLLLSKGVTAERLTGVVPNREKVIDGLILAYVPAGTRIQETLAKTIRH